MESEKSVISRCSESVISCQTRGERENTVEPGSFKHSRPPNRAKFLVFNFNAEVSPPISTVVNTPPLTPVQMRPPCRPNGPGTRDKLHGPFVFSEKIEKSHVLSRDSTRRPWWLVVVVGRDWYHHFYYSYLPVPGRRDWSVPHGTQDYFQHLRHTVHIFKLHYLHSIIYV